MKYPMNNLSGVHGRYTSEGNEHPIARKAWNEDMELSGCSFCGGPADHFNGRESDYMCTTCDLREIDKLTHENE
jgi:hypothetical protein